MKETQAKKEPKKLIEDYSFFDIGSFGRGLLYQYDGKGKKGSLVFPSLRYSHISYYVEWFDSLPCLFVYIQDKDTPIKIYLSSSQSTFGKRPYFHCPGCNSSRRKLYMRGDAFLCRECLNLIHESTRLHRAHPIVRILNKHLKLIVMSENVKRISYNGRYTRRAKRVIELSNKLKYGLNRQNKAIIPT